MKIRPVKAEVLHTDRHDESKFAVRNFTNAPRQYESKAMRGKYI